MNRFSSILYVTEPDQAAESTHEQASAMARAVALAENHQARLTLLAVAEEPRLGRFGDVLPAGEFESRFRRDQLDHLRALLAPHGERVQADMQVRLGTPFLQVVREVLRNRHDLVLKAAGDDGVGAFLFGGTDQHLLRKCPCPVWIMTAGGKLPCKRVLAAVDVDPWQADDTEAELNRHILELAASVAIAEFAELHIVHAWAPINDNLVRVFGSELSRNQVVANVERERQDHHDKLQQLSQSLRGWLGAEAHELLAPRVHLHQGRPREVIPQCARQLDADLLVMGTVSRTGVSGFIIGNTAEMILGSIRCSVLAVKPRGFVSPVTVEE